MGQDLRSRAEAPVVMDCIDLAWLRAGRCDATVFVMRGEGMHHAWVRLFWTCVAGWIPWGSGDSIGALAGAAVSSGVKLRPVWTWFAHLAACAAVGLSFAAWMAWMDFAFNPYARHSWTGTLLGTLDG